MEIFAVHGDLGHEFRRGLEVPVGIRDVCMTEVGAQCEHVAFDVVRIGAALLKGMNGKGVPQIMQTGARLTGACAQSDGAGQT
jgi:hypothetical protein